MIGTNETVLSISSKLQYFKQCDCVCYLTFPDIVTILLMDTAVLVILGLLFRKEIGLVLRWLEGKKLLPKQ